MDGFSYTERTLCVRLLQSSTIFCDPVDGSPPGSSVSETIWAWLLEWVAMPSSSRSSEPVDRTRVSYVSALEVASLSLMPFAL